jgi:hypothetical protein
MVPISDQELEEGLRNEDIEIWVCSFGGCGSNMLLAHLTNNGFRVKSKTYDERACHFPHPIELKGVKAIYLYGDPFLSIVSQYSRKLLLLNLQKASNYERRDTTLSQDLSDLQLEPFLNQFKLWTISNAIGDMPILHIRYEELWKQWNKIQVHLNSSLPPPKKIIRNTYLLSSNCRRNIVIAIRRLSEEIKIFETRKNLILPFIKKQK